MPGGGGLFIGGPGKPGGRGGGPPEGGPGGGAPGGPGGGARGGPLGGMPGGTLGARFIQSLGGGPTTFLYIFVHVHFGKNLVAMYINVQKIFNR